MRQRKRELNPLRLIPRTREFRRVLACPQDPLAVGKPVTEVLRINYEHTGRADYQMVNICLGPGNSSVVKDHEAFATELVEVVPKPFLPFGSLTPSDGALVGHPDTQGRKNAGQDSEEEAELVSQATAEWRRGSGFLRRPRLQEALEEVVERSRCETHHEVRGESR